MRSKIQLKSQRIRNKANKFLDEYFDYKTTYVPVVEIAHKMGFEVYNVDMEKEFESFIVVEPSEQSIFNSNTNKVIGVSDKISHEHKRCAVAYQLANYILNNNDKGISYRTRVHNICNGKSEVDRLAVEMLMPKQLISVVYATLSRVYSRLSIGELTEQVANGLGVPIGYAMHRLAELNLV